MRSYTSAASAVIRASTYALGAFTLIVGCGGGDTVGPAVDTDVEVEVPVVWAALMAGGSNYFMRTCGLTIDGVAYCWGGLPLERTNVPTKVPGGLTFSTLAIGWKEVCGLTPTGTAYCWGEYLGTRTDNPLPVAVGHTFSAIAEMSGETCALDMNGTIYCWSNNHESTPEPFADYVQFETLSGEGYLCGISEDSETYCWRGSDFAVVPGGHEFMTVDTGNGLISVTDACAVTEDGEAYCWKKGGTPHLVSEDLYFSDVATGDDFSCGVATTGLAYCWGENDWGQLGKGSTIPRSSEPVPVAGGIIFKTVTAGGVHACGVTEAGEAYCWGSNSDGQLGTGQSYADYVLDDFSNAPVRVTNPRR